MYGSMLVVQGERETNGMPMQNSVVTSVGPKTHRKQEIVIGSPVMTASWLFRMAQICRQKVPANLGRKKANV